MHSAARRARKPLTLLALLGAVAALVLGGAGPASAHAVLTRSAPSDTSVVKKAPREVSISFTQPVGLPESSLRVLSPRNVRVSEGRAEHSDGSKRTARIALTDKLMKGTYTVSWRVISDDGHPISGAFTFSVGKPSATSAALSSVPSADPVVSLLNQVSRYAAYGGLTLLVGVAGFVLLCWPAALALRLVRRLLLAGWLTLAGSALLLLLLRGPYETGRGVLGAFDPSLLASTLGAKAGTLLLIRMLLVIAAGLVVARWAGRPADRAGSDAEPAPPGTGVRIAGVLLSVALAVTWAAAEHASVGPQVAVAIPAAVLHILAMTVWLGGLLTLVLMLRRTGTGPEVPASAVARFSRLAFGAVAVLTVTGVYQSWRQVGSLGALASTEYGRLLSAKVVLVVLVLAAAAFSRRWTARLVRAAPAAPRRTAAESPRRVPVTQTVGGGSAAAHDGSAPLPPPSPAGVGGPDVPDEPSRPVPSGPPREEHRRGLRRSVAVEAVLSLIVLAITTVLTGTQSSRAVAQSAAFAAVPRQPPTTLAVIPFDTGAPGGSGRVQVTLSPGQVGENVVQAVVYGPTGLISAVPEMRITLTQRARGIGPLDAKLTDLQGWWSGDTLRLPVPGTWLMRVTVRVSDVDQTTVSQNVTIKALP
ncbi:putative integral membrane protein [Streptomyces zinciresistens K42]|uniref:Putative integral membrane protein n=1 Tax=Streptomyces zinciresistens K42 TaxID=700597 RepID=G2GI43_9ACTN|nr:copper resistance protein CopC [Streptomyces zinciresistens]EGX56810.1 putative integral membrane protein [Streptomyces zinciresistens K42]